MNNKTKDPTLRFMSVADIFALVPEGKDLLKEPWVAGQYLGMGKICVTDAVYPGGHFGTYFGALPLRQGVYRNPYIQLLYYLHELKHMQTIRYDNSRSWLGWQRSIILSELISSLTSECYSYLHIPGLRPKTFKHEIWVDRFLPLCRFLPIRLVEWYIRRERLRALHAPQFNDFIEYQIRNYGAQNIAWCRIWAAPVGYGPFVNLPAYRVVEAHMSSERSFDPIMHSQWLEDVTHPVSGIPFSNQAFAFETVYKESNAHYGNQMLLS